MTLVVDASVATLWVLEQDGTPRALAVRNEDSLIAPSLIAAEIGSALWKAVRRRHVKRADAATALDAALLAFEALIPLEELRARALELAMELEHPIYDCFYLALAERESAPLVTADAALAAKAKRAKGIEIRKL